MNAFPGGGLNPLAPNSPPTNNPPPPPLAGRAWYIDDIVVATFALLGFGGAVLLPLRYSFSNVPPIVVSFLLATGLAALTYKYLGGISPGTSVAIGTLKLGGTLAALVGIAMLINTKLVSQIPRWQVWEVSGQVTEESGKPIQPLDQNDIALAPPPLQSSVDGKFKLDLYSWQDLDGNNTFPMLSISHKGFDSHPVDLNPSASNDVEIKRSGQHIQIGRIPLHVPVKKYDPPNVVLTPVPFSVEQSSVPVGTPQ
jgi:hypothetical protein